jgi:hypothetical protein
MPSAAGQTAQALVTLGVQFDFISDAQLLASRCEEKQIKTSGNTYSGLILVPKTEHMPVETLRQLRALAASGATVRFLDAMPADVPGFGGLEQRRTQLRELLAPLDWKVAHFRTAEVQRAKIDNAGYFELMHLAELGESALPSAVGDTPLLSREPLTDLGLSFVRRQSKEDHSHLYFIVNHSGRTINEWVPLVMATRNAVALLDPLTGTAGTASTRNSSKNYWGGSRATREIREVFLQLAPGESLFVRTLPEPDARRALWAYRESAGAPIPLNGEWRVTFTEGGPALPAARTMAALHSWADDADEAAQVFGGTARYETEFTLPANPAAEDWLLDLGDVRETARVFINGKEVNRVWSLPTRTRLGALAAGKNTLTLEVTSTAANRIRDLDKRGAPWKAFYEINFVNLFYKPFNAADWKLQPCGLLGPVTLTPLRTAKP